jgi:PST family polysaccharide transporter
VLVFVLAKVPLEVGVDPAIARRLLRFGLPLAGSLGLEAVLTNADYVIVGRQLGAVALGFYLLAFNVSSWAPSVIGTAVRYVSVPGFSRLAERDGELAAGAERAIPLLITAVVPILMIMVTLAPALVEFLYGPQWAPAAPVFRLLAVLTFVRMLGSFAFDILASAGASRLAFWMTFGWTVPLVPALLIGTRYGGIQGTAVAHAVVAVFVAVPLVVISLRRIGVRFTPICRGSVRPLCAGVVSALCCTTVARVTALSPFFELVSAGAVAIIVYVGLVLTRAQMHDLIRRVGQSLNGAHGRLSQVRGGVKDGE